jgi:hypothetical protein
MIELYCNVFPDHDYHTVGSIWETLEDAEANYDYRNDLYILKCHAGHLYDGNDLVGERIYRLSFDDATVGFYSLLRAYGFPYGTFAEEFIDYLLNNGCIVNTPEDVLSEAIKLFQEHTLRIQNDKI